MRIRREHNDLKKPLQNLPVGMQECEDATKTPGFKVNVPNPCTPSLLAGKGTGDGFYGLIFARFASLRLSGEGNRVSFL